MLLLLALAMTSNMHAQRNLVKIEAENTHYSKCEVVVNAKYSGNKALRMTDPDARIVLSVDADVRERYAVFVAGEGIGGEKQVNCSVNGSGCQFKLNQYGEVEVGTFILNAGNNEIVVSPSWTWFDIDYIRIESNQQSITFDIAKEPIDGNATEPAKKMYRFLVDNFGKKTIAGMMLGDMSSYQGDVTQHADLLAVYQVSGKYPALVGLDFMNATGKSESNPWNIDYTRKMVNAAKDIYVRGGIPAFTWHWRDPSRSTDAFYSDESKANISSALRNDGSWDTSSALYRNIIRDIDAIADFFIELQDEDMACVFRPLHEGSGGWFWWGREGAENFRRLYHLVYDEMVNVKGVHNVIWVWNAGVDDQEWNPGDEYYDIVSADIYNASFDYSSNYPTFDKLKSLTQGKKIIALSENGPIPDIEKEIEDESVWSWWMPWYQTWNGGFVDQTSSEEWRKCMSDSHVITLDKMEGLWGASSSISNIALKKEECTILYDLSGRAVSGEVTKGIYITKDGRKIIR